MATSFLSCDNIYDEPEGRILRPTTEQKYQFVNATKYTDWVYFNLHSKTEADSVTLDYRDTEHIPSKWDIAIHRYDVKTNGGGALETNFSTLEEMRTAAESGSYRKPFPSEFIADNPDDSVTIDMSTMMLGYLSYAKSPVNRELGKWLHLDLSTMPPIYTLSEKVYLVCMADKTIAAIRFCGYSNPNYYNTKGYISFDYLYPLNFAK